MLPAVTRVPSHIIVDADGVARIDGTRIKVIHVAAERVARNATPEEMQQAWPHLTLSQIHAALAYYYDHKEALDAEIERSLKEYEEQLAKERGNASPLRQKLRDLGHLK